MSRRKQERKPRLLMFGPRPIRGDVIGGTKVIFSRLEEQFADSGRFDVRSVNTSRPFARFGSEESGLRRAALDLYGFARVLGHLLLRAWRADVVLFNASSRGVLRAGPFVHAVCRLYRKPLVFRLFGADFGLHWERSSAPRRWLARLTLLRANLFLLETEALCRRFAPLARTRRFANTRDVPATRPAKSPGGVLAALAADADELSGAAARGARFAFVGQLRLEKGLLLALKASDELPPGCALEVYGPLLLGVEPELFDAHPRASYGGTLEPEEVPATLARFDALVFPTLYETEGIPGVVLEAMQSGVPVIASRWSAAEELVEDGASGLLVPQGSVAELAAAMRRVESEPELRERLARGARERGDLYRSQPWHRRLEAWLGELAGAAPGRDEDAGKRDSRTRRRAA